VDADGAGDPSVHRTVTGSLAEALAGVGEGTIGISSGIPASQRSTAIEVASGRVEWLPLLNGAAVVRPGLDLAVLGWPNGLGRLESDGSQVLHLWDRSLAEAPPGRVIAYGRTAPDVAERTALARTMVKRLAQLRGVVVPWVPETPIAVVLVPDPSPVPDALHIAEPGLPGGIRIVIEPGTTADAAREYAAELAAAMGG